MMDNKHEIKISFDIDEEDCCKLSKIIKKYIDDKQNPIVRYSLSLVGLRFNGETSNHGNEVSDRCNTPEKYHLGVFLRLLHTFLQSFENVYEVTGNEKTFLLLLKLIALKRRNKNDTRSSSYQRLFYQKDRFIRIYHQRGVLSQEMGDINYWGSRQQLRAGKVIGDFIDMWHGPLDPIFGILLSPAAGRTGPGDSRIMHKLLFDHSGPVAYHSVIHDSFGYLYQKHAIGPGYNYLQVHDLFPTSNPCSGQISGLLFWKKALKKHALMNDNGKVIH